MKTENVVDVSMDICEQETTDICECENMEICECENMDICERTVADDLDDELRRLIAECEQQLAEIKNSMKEEDQQVFQVQTEDGIVHDATLLSVVEIDGKEYAVYAIPNGLKNVDILASYVEKDEDGYDVLRDIDDPIDKAKISEFVKSLAL